MSDFSDAVLALNPIAYYRLNETVGPTLHDSGPNALNGTIGSAIGLNGPALIKSDPTARSFVFPGGAPSPNYNATIPPNPLLQPKHFSIAFMLELPSYPPSHTELIAASDNGSTYAFNIAVFGSNLGLYMNSAGVYNISTLATGTHFIVATYDGSAVNLWVDGVAGGAQPYAGGDITYPNPSIGLVIGNPQSTTVIAGNIAEVGFFSYGLSPAQVHTLNAATNPAPNVKITGGAAVLRTIAQRLGAGAAISGATGAIVSAAAHIAATSFRAIGAAASVLSAIATLPPVGGGATVAQKKSLSLGAGAIVTPITANTTLGAGAFIVPVTVRQLISAGAAIVNGARTLLGGGARILVGGQNTTFIDRKVHAEPVERVDSVDVKYRPEDREW